MAGPRRIALFGLVVALLLQQCVTDATSENNHTDLASFSNSSTANDTHHNTTEGHGEEAHESEHEPEGFTAGIAGLTIIVLVASLVAANLLHHVHFVYLPESGLFILVGLIIGIIARASGLADQVTFNGHFVFLVLIPPIIFQAGFDLKKDHLQGLFFHNIGSILVFAMVGTMISTCTVGICLYYTSKAGWFVQSFGLAETLAFGSLISATDPVAVLAVFSALGVDPQVFILVAGESILNDAVAVVLYKTFKNFITGPFSGEEVGRAIGIFFANSVGAASLGVVFGVLTTLLFKYGKMMNNPYLESAVLTCLSVSSYLVSEAISLSGIVAVLFSGIVMGSFATRNLSTESQMISMYTFKIFAVVAETFVFFYLGLVLPVLEHVFDVPLILFTFFLCLVGRALNVFPLSALVNRFRKTGMRTNRIDFRQQLMMWFSGLRGAIAFSLAFDIPGPTQKIFVTTSAVIALFTVFVLGGSTVPMLNLLKIQKGVIVEKWLETTSEREDGLWFKIHKVMARVKKVLLVPEDSPAQEVYELERERSLSILEKLVTTTMDHRRLSRSRSESMRLEVQEAMADYASKDHADHLSFEVDAAVLAHQLEMEQLRAAHHAPPAMGCFEETDEELGSRRPSIDTTTPTERRPSMDGRFAGLVPHAFMGTHTPSGASPKTKTSSPPFAASAPPGDAPNLPSAASLPPLVPHESPKRPPALACVDGESLQHASAVPGASPKLTPAMSALAPQSSPKVAGLPPLGNTSPKLTLTATGGLAPQGSPGKHAGLPQLGNTSPKLSPSLASLAPQGSPKLAALPPLGNTSPKLTTAMAALAPPGSASPLTPAAAAGGRAPLAVSELSPSPFDRTGSVLFALDASHHRYHDLSPIHSGVERGSSQGSAGTPSDPIAFSASSEARPDEIPSSGKAVTFSDQGGIAPGRDGIASDQGGITPGHDAIASPPTTSGVVGGDDGDDGIEVEDEVLSGQA